MEWGTSFIGCDVCASKLNDDPFGDDTRPGDAWAAMQKKIAEAERRLKAEAAAAEAAAVGGAGAAAGTANGGQAAAPGGRSSQG